MAALEHLYFAAPVWMQNLMVSVYGYYQRGKRYGGGYSRVLDDVRRVSTATRPEIERLQSERLARMLDYCVERVPFYRGASRKGPADGLSAFPVLTKGDVRRHRQELLATGSRPFWTNQTSGSTGTPLSVELDADTYRMLMALLVDHEERHGVRPGDVRATFAGRIVLPQSDARPPFWRYNHAERQYLFSTLHLSDASMPRYLDCLRRIQPREIIGYPSAIYTVAEYCARTGTEAGIRPAVVVTNSETVFDWQRKVIETVYGCRVADYYGLAEGVVFASECRYGRYHFNPLIGAVEVLRADGQPAQAGEPGRLVCTSLTNYRMPLVRYDTGDEVVLEAGGCDCGSAHPSASRILGRADDAVVTADGRSVGRLDHIFKGAVGVRECQIVQTGVSRIVLKVVPDGDLSETARQSLVANLRARVGEQMQVDIELVEAIPRTSRGKFKGVVSLVSRSAAH
jgi:phenylacetate-CoA ligase